MLLGDGRILLFYNHMFLYILERNSERTEVALVALAGMVGTLVIETLMIWKDLAPFFDYSSFGI